MQDGVAVKGGGQAVEHDLEPVYLRVCGIAPPPRMQPHEAETDFEHAERDTEQESDQAVLERRLLHTRFARRRPGPLWGRRRPYPR